MTKARSAIQLAMTASLLALSVGSARAQAAPTPITTANSTPQPSAPQTPSATTAGVDAANPGGGGTPPAVPASDASPGGNGQTANPAPSTTNGIEDIVVTAQRRSENLQRTPIAITAITASALQSQGITSLTGLVQAAPSLYFAPYPSSSSTLVLFMRGQGIGDPMIITKDGGVGLYVDGIYQSRPQAATFDLADVERVEVLRGPQGTLYGRNTTGGAVNIIPKRPTGIFGVHGLLSAGNYDYARALVNIDLPEFNNFKIKLTGLFSNIDGWARNAKNTSGVPDANDFQGDRKIAGRGAIEWTPSSDVTIDYAADYSETRTTPIRYVTDSPYAPLLFPGYTMDPARTYRPVYLPYSYTRSDGQTLIAEFRPSSSLTLRSLTGYRHVNFVTNQDYVESFLAPFFTIDQVHSKTWTQEFQAIGNVADQFKYVFGLYYFNEKADHTQIIDSGTGTAGQLFESTRLTIASSTSKAAYGQVTWTPALTGGIVDLTVGGRYTSDVRTANRTLGKGIFIGQTSPLVARRFNGPGVTIPLGTTVGATDVRNNRFNPSVTLAVRPAENVNLYAKFVTGYKAGGANESSPTFTRTFAPEKVTSYEVGLKTDLFDRRLRFNVAAFIAKYRDLQVDLQTTPNDPSQVDTFNLGRATVKGFETDLTLVPVNGLTIQASYSFTTYTIANVVAPAGSVFDPAINPSAPSRVGSDITGYFVLPFTPRNSLRVSGDWQIGQIGPGKLAAHADYTFKDQVFTSAGDGPAVPFGRSNYKNPSYGLVDGRFTYTLERAGGRNISFALWGKNIFNKRYPAFNIAGGGTALTGFTAADRSYGSPRTYGIDIGFAF